MNIDTLNEIKGYRTDLKRILNLIKNNVSLKDIAEEYPYQFCRYNRIITECYESLFRDDRPRDFYPEVIVLWGDSGTGKSRMAFKYYHGHSISYDGKFFNGYASNMETVVFDNFEHSDIMPLPIWLKITDNHPMTVKGIDCFNEDNDDGVCYNWRPKRIIFTMIENPLETWYVKPLLDGKVSPPVSVLSRISEIRHFTVGGSLVGELVWKNNEKDQICKMETLEDRKKIYEELLSDELEERKEM